MMNDLVYQNISNSYARLYKSGLKKACVAFIWVGQLDTQSVVRKAGKESRKIGARWSSRKLARNESAVSTFFVNQRRRLLPFPSDWNLW